jgi:hypothetical protein
VHGMLRSSALYPFQKVLDWPSERFEQVVKAAQEELRSPKRIFFEL